MSKGLTNNINETFSFGVIYVYSIPDEKHTGRLKIGSATITSSDPTQENINSTAHERIQQQTKTADILYVLEHAELAVTNAGAYFSDHNVHQVLIRSGYERKAESVKNTHSEWFEVSLEVAKNAIQAVKEGRAALSTKERITSRISEFPFRPNQREAIDKTTKAIKKNRKHFLWNAKMRFGKTSAAMQVAKENGMGKVIIATHRPSVGACRQPVPARSSRAGGCWTRTWGGGYTAPAMPPRCHGSSSPRRRRRTPRLRSPPEDHRTHRRGARGEAIPPPRASPLPHAGSRPRVPGAARTADRPPTRTRFGAHRSGPRARP